MSCCVVVCVVMCFSFEENLFYAENNTACSIIRRWFWEVRFISKSAGSDILFLSKMSSRLIIRKLKGCYFLLLLGPTPVSGLWGLFYY